LEGVLVGDGYGLLCNSLGLSPSLALQAYSNTAAAGMVTSTLIGSRSLLMSFEHSYQ
jgi:hypothetical protein